MEKPTGVIQKIIESLQQINALDTYSPIEKDIILHNLRAAYMIFLNVPAKEESVESRVEQLFQECGMRYEVRGERCEVSGEQQPVGAENLLPTEETENPLPTAEIIEEIIEEEIMEGGIEEVVEEEKVEEIVEEEIFEEVPEIKEKVESVLQLELPEEEQPQEELEEIGKRPQQVVEVIKVPEILETSTTSAEPLHDDILEFIPDAQPTLLSEETIIPKSEKKSLNDLLTEKKDDNSLGAKFQQSVIPDLTKAIAINEKFSFIRELFHNSGVDFSNAIQKLNECENIDVAFNLMEELKHQYLWDTTSSTYLSLCDLVRRRFL
ncbi:MAG: hypothetical protein FWC34_01560 [Bacteroidetes bacterium]|nr:hypothetical protein [Bacteroidota bacterium]MCL2303246.1 hypothetical protein [Lentimicrobiaceae bacterium]